MKKYVCLVIMIAAAAFLSACGDQSATNAGNSANKPANAANSTANSNTAAPANTAAIEADIKKLITDYAASTAKNDADAYDKVTTDNFMFVSNDGAVQTKAERITSMKSGATKYVSLTYDDVSVRVNPEGNGAVAIAKATVKGTNMGKPIDATVRVTQVWSKTKDGWKMASLQATNITAKDDGAKPANSNAATANTAKPAAPPANK